MNVSAVAVQVFVGGECETQTINNMTRLVDEGMRYGMPVLGVTAVGKDLARDSRYIALASRMLAELGAAIIKTYFCDDFDKVVAACPVPIIIAGGKKLSEFDALTMARKAIDAGASGVDMGRNIFQSDAPIAMLTAVRKVVHENMSAMQAFELYTEMKNR
jgi:putative autoinducer-2 (AI-2) aldolase